MIFLTKVFVEDILYLVIALWKLEKPIVRKVPEGAFRYKNRFLQNSIKNIAD